MAVHVKFDISELRFSKVISIGVFSMSMNCLKWYGIFAVMIISGTYLGVAI